MITTAELLKLIATLSFEPFTESDWECWSGCESEAPVVCYAEKFTIVIDGDKISYQDAEGEFAEQLFRLSDF
jgi:hypothetical protein